MSVYSVDRIEGSLAVLVDDEGCSHTEPLTLLPCDVREGTILRRTAQGFIHDVDEENVRRCKVLSLQEKLRSRAKK